MPTFTLGPPVRPPHELIEDIGEHWRARTAMGQEARAGKRGEADRLLTAAGVKFEWRNGGAHLIVHAPDGRVVDFWPGTSKWTIRGETEVRRGGLKKTRAVQCTTALAGAGRAARRPCPGRAATELDASGRYPKATSATSRANAIAAARPMPESPPVMSALRPARRPEPT